ncbi:MAG: redox-sensing transcriptional repressor Rex [Treponema sp.]|jgi:redox-sensing transcriptional repressor|nr:redox-sensing transcriptional repressor Rex [Treponema sp.]
MKNLEISAPTKKRLLYLLKILEKSESISITSSRIEEETGWSRDTVRKDISALGGLGSANGYETEHLSSAIRKALGLDKRRRLCIVGLGRLGSAYLNFGALNSSEFELAAGFDTNVNRVEILSSPVPLYPAYKMSEIIERLSINIGLLCVPEAQAQSAAEKLIRSGICGIVNFAPVVLKTPPSIAVRNVFVIDELRTLAAFL